VGLELAHGIAARLPAGAVAVTEASVGGIELLQVLEVWEQVLIVASYIDPLGTGRLAPGEVRELELAELGPAQSAISPHTAGLVQCLELGRACGMVMPTEVRVFVMGVSDPYTFGESCTPAVAAAIPSAIELIAARVLGAEGWRLVRRKV
jgi:hydrogenase maturation protease